MAPFKRVRQPKMTTQALLAFDLGESSSSDSDFRIEDHNEEDDFSDASKDDDDNSDDSSSSSSSDSNYSADSDDDLQGKLPDAGGGGGGGGGGSEDSTQQLRQLLAEDVEVAHPNGSDLEKMLKHLDSTRAAKPLKMLTKPICCVCLGDRSDDTNEIIECDGCSVSVHEGCYGVSDNASISSTNSTCSTEPWFCEACRAGVNEPVCELCPNRGGIFKETDVGKWVHLVCALYIRGVAFGEVDQLSSVTLFEMPYSKWGAKVCSLCENSRFARTGVCIECDAGMCKAFFHVTCAQAAGFLTEGQNEDEALDPYYAHCKVHSDKEMLKKRKRNFHMLRVHMEQKQKEALARKSDDPCPALLRNKRKLFKYQQHYQKHKQLKGSPWVPTQKMSRLLTTSASACKRLMAKAAIMAVDVELLERQESQIAALTDIRKKWHIPAAFSVEFIGYYLDRISRSKDIKQELTGMVENNVRLTKEQDMLRKEYDGHLEQNKAHKAKNEHLLAAIALLHKQIVQVYPKNFPLPANIGSEPLPNDQLKIDTPPLRPISVPTAAALKMGVGFPLAHLGPPGTKVDSTRLLSTQAANASPTSCNAAAVVANMSTKNPAPSTPTMNHDCGICKHCHDQHLMTKCDTCKLFYHLDCLNPPLSRPPKKSKLYGWQCSECDKSDESDAVSQIPKGPRKSRTRFNKDGTIEKITNESSTINQSSQNLKRRSVDAVQTNVLTISRTYSTEHSINSLLGEATTATGQAEAQQQLKQQLTPTAPVSSPKKPRQGINLESPTRLLEIPDQKLKEISTPAACK